MASHVKRKQKARYEDDFYAWCRIQAELLREGRVSQLDLGHLTEEVEDLADALKRSVRHRTRTIIEHLLKLQHSPAQDPRAGWRATVRAQRVRLGDGLTSSLRAEIEAELAELYADARGLAEGALRDYGENAAADALPKTCPYSLDQITGEWLP